MTTNSIEDVVLAQAREVLGHDDVTLDTDFFEAGGDSVLGMHFVGRVGRTLELPVRTTTLFGNPVLAEFADEVSALARRTAARSGEMAGR